MASATQAVSTLCVNVTCSLGVRQKEANTANAATSRCRQLTDRLFAAAKSRHGHKGARVSISESFNAETGARNPNGGISVSAPAEQYPNKRPTAPIQIVNSGGNPLHASTFIVNECKLTTH